MPKVLACTLSDPGGEGLAVSTIIRAPASRLPFGSLDLPPKGSTLLVEENTNNVALLCFARNTRFIACLLFVVLSTSAFGDEKSGGQTPPGSTKEDFAHARAIGKDRSAYLNSQPVAVDDARTSKPERFAKSIKPILQNACVHCHGSDAQEGNIRIDSLNPDLVKGSDVDWWLEVLAVLNNGEMPPPDEPDLSEGDRAKVVDWLANEIQAASMVKRASASHSSFRRMTRYEFNYALQDLLGLPFDFATDLPPEANSEDGFQNSSDLLHMSVSQLETYRRLARKALLRATVEGQRPDVVHWGITMHDAGRVDWQKQKDEANKIQKETKDDPDKQKKRLADFEKQSTQPHPVPYFKNLETGRTVRANWSYHRARYANESQASPRPIPAKLDHVAVIPKGHSRFTIELGNTLPDEGTMRVRVRASKLVPNDKGTPTLKLQFGWQASNEGRALLDVPDGEREIVSGPDDPQFYQWDVPLGEIYPRNSVRKTSKMGEMPNPSEYIRLVNSSVSQGPIRVDYVEIAAPIYAQWPPASHQRIFIDRDDQGDDKNHARKIISRFMRQAWRREITRGEVKQKLKLFAAIRPTCDSFEEAVVEVLATVLASPQFLYVSSGGDESKQLEAHELATRLSMFLWSSIPDKTLNRLANDGKLLDAKVLEEQTDRMLADVRSDRLPKHFVHQWLDMQLLEFRTMPRGLESLKVAMQQEPIAVFGEMLRTNASVLDFLHADYTMANERLAVHYGLPNVKGNQFRRVALQREQNRGGLLTSAGLLTMNSAGDESHPLKRGVWLLESLLHDPPPPPPPAVPEIDLADPEIAKMTLKERIEDHRNHAACMSCHAKIDPWGIAFENYDALGRWRTKLKGKPVDASSTLFNQQRLEGMVGLKRFLLENRQDQFVRAMVHKLTTYALGRPLAFSDRASVNEITAKVRQQGDGLATMVKLISSSDLFRSK